MRGVAHAVVLDLLDQLGVRPKVIAGTSMGAIMGALYASGMTGGDILERLHRHIITKSDSRKEILAKRQSLYKWLSAFSPRIARGGVVKVDRFLDYLFAEINAESFEDLDIPLIVMATDFWAAESLAIESGDLRQAINASIAVPGVFGSVKMGERVLVDGGVVNNLPYDLLMDRCEVVIAVDVRATRTPGNEKPPSAFEMLVNSFDIMGTATLSQKMKHTRPDIYVRPRLENIRMFDLDKTEEILGKTREAMPGLEQEIRQKVF